MTSDATAHRAALLVAGARGGGRCGRAGGVRAQQVPGDDAEVHLVGAVGQAQAAGAGVGGGEREVLAHAAPTVQLDGEVDDVAGHLRHGRLDLGDLGLGARRCRRCRASRRRAARAGGPELMAIRARARRSRLPPRLAIGLPKATRLVERSQASSSAFSARPMRRMQWCTRPGPRRPWAISKARPGPARIAVRGRRTPLRRDLAVAERLVVLAERGEHPLDLDAGGLERHDDHRVLAVPVGAGVGEAHEDADLAVGVAGAGRPPLAAVEHDVVAVEGGGGLHVGGVGAGDAGLGHQERAAHPPVEQRLEPLLLLLGRAVAQQHLHVAGVGGVAVEAPAGPAASGRSARRRRRSRCW